MAACAISGLPGSFFNRRLQSAFGTSDPLLQARLACEHRQTARIDGGLARPTFVLPWLPEPPMGVLALGALAAPGGV